MTTPLERTAFDVQIEYHAAQAMWAAMHDDDDLANDYVSLAVIHALNHLVETLGPDPYTKNEWDRIRRNLNLAREVAKLGEQEMADRWSSYNEPPF